jgi:hypothetical protein
MEPGSGAGALTGHSGFGRGGRGGVESRRAALLDFGRVALLDFGRDDFFVAAGAVRSVRLTESIFTGGGVESPADCAADFAAMSDRNSPATRAARGTGESRPSIVRDLNITRAA